MNANFLEIAELLDVLGAVAGIAKAGTVGKVLLHAAALVRLGEEARARRKLLVQQAKVWVAEGREPSTEEIARLDTARDGLDAELAVLQADLRARVGS